jgi:hypothetical protein
MFPEVDDDATGWDPDLSANIDINIDAVDISICASRRAGYIAEELNWLTGRTRERDPRHSSE